MSENVSKVEIQITLNEEKIPSKIEWSSTDIPNGESKVEAKAMFLGLFDKEKLETLRFDIWTSEMQVIEMDRFVFQTLRSLSDTYFNATKNTSLANDMQKFVQYFGQKTEILKSEE
jgi:gliding motility-associated protein GldC